MPTVRSLLIVVSLLAIGCKKDAPAVEQGQARTVALTVTAEGFMPAETKVKKGEPLNLKITRLTDQTCATEILIDGTDINVPLPLNRTVEVAYTPSKSGKIRYGCAMGMMVSGVLLVE